jgi:hypothetical protein
LIDYEGDKVKQSQIICILKRARVFTNIPLYIILTPRTRSFLKYCSQKCLNGKEIAPPIETSSKMMNDEPLEKVGTGRV